MNVKLSKAIKKKIHHPFSDCYDNLCLFKSTMINSFTVMVFVRSEQQNILNVYIPITRWQLGGNPLCISHASSLTLTDMLPLRCHQSLTSRTKTFRKPDLANLPEYNSEGKLNATLLPWLKPLLDRTQKLDRRKTGWQVHMERSGLTWIHFEVHVAGLRVTYSQRINKVIFVMVK